MDWLAMTLSADRAHTPWRCPESHGDTRSRTYSGSKDNDWRYGRHWRGDEGNGWDWRIPAVEDPKDCSKLNRARTETSHMVMD
jgi:hypothetical protein